MSLTAGHVSDPALEALLAGHPAVSLVEGEATAELAFTQGQRWDRVVFQTNGEANPDTVIGLVELMDNNPMVCADQVGVPSPGATLAMIGLGPLIRAGLLAADPVVTFTFEVNAADVILHAERMGWEGDVISVLDEVDLGSVLAANVMAEVPPMADWDALDELFEEAYGRSFFVRRVEEGAWDTQLVAGKHHAAYRLRLSPGDENALLTIQVMADRDGKAGAAQLIHAMNVMVGFEECLGLMIPAP